MKDIKSMKLYHHPDRIYNELAALGKDETDTISFHELCSFDQYHYRGTKVLDEAIEIFQIGSGDRILDIGSGIGGPARYLAGKTGCKVTALEIQSDLHEVAVNLTKRCDLASLVEHVDGDILQFKDRYHNYDFVISLLSFLHIPDRIALLKICHDVLKPGGCMFIEDFYKLNEMEMEELKILSTDIYCDYLPSFQEYKKQLIDCGFTEIELIDKTDNWKKFVNERRDDFSRHREDQIKKHDVDIVDDLEDFYIKMALLYNGGNLGGLRVLAKNI
jgi:cyclopropane fatty-acyl-phospholipid synthase-like methyltransferase